MKYKDIAQELKTKPLGDDLNFRIGMVIDQKDGYPWLTHAMQTWLEDPDFKIQEVQVQRQFTIIPGTKTSVLDLLVTDIHDHQYNVEIQRYSLPDEQFGRWFYYISQIIVQQVAYGEDYSLIDSASAIIVCKEDPLGKDLPVYTIEPNVRELGIPLEDLIKRNLYSIRLINAEANSDDAKNILARSVFEANINKIEDAQTADLVRKLRSDKKENSMEIRDMIDEYVQEHYKDVIQEKDEKIARMEEKDRLRDEEIEKLREENARLKRELNAGMKC